MTTRADLADHLNLSPTAPTKTYVLDVHTDDPDRYLADLVAGAGVEATSDAALWGVHLPGGEDFWVDQLDSRFWSFHTDMRGDTAQRYLRERVEARRDLDWVWLPSEHVRKAAPGTSARRVRTSFSGKGLLGSNARTSKLNLDASGSVANEVLDYLTSSKSYRSAVSLEAIQVSMSDPDDGWLNEGVNRMGRFAASGDALELHFQFVRSVVARYAHLVDLLEANAIGWDPLDSDGGGTLSGAPVTVAFSRPVPDMERFVEEMFAARQPFRLWGAPHIDDGVAEIDAVDLHVGQLLRIDVGPTWMRIYLQRGSCGNSVARLVSNLQHGFDSALSIIDPSIQRAFATEG